MDHTGICPRPTAAILELPSTEDLWSQGYNAKIKGNGALDNLRDEATKVHYGPGRSQVKYVQIQGTVSDHWRDKLALKTSMALERVVLFSIIMV